VVGWVRAGELAVLVGGDQELAAALGKWGWTGGSWWDVWAQDWEGLVKAGSTGWEEGEGDLLQEGAVDEGGCAGWYCPVVVEGESMGRTGGTVLQVRLVLVAVGWDAGKFVGAVRLAGCREWRLAGMKRRQLRAAVVGRVEAGGVVELVAGAELLEEWDHGPGDDEGTEWRAEAMEGLAQRRRQMAGGRGGSKEDEDEDEGEDEEDRDKTYDRG
jgi:hypothetical protein